MWISSPKFELEFLFGMKTNNVCMLGSIISKGVAFIYFVANSNLSVCGS